MQIKFQGTIPHYSVQILEMDGYWIVIEIPIDGINKIKYISFCYAEDALIYAEMLGIKMEDVCPYVAKIITDGRK